MLVDEAAYVPLKWFCFTQEGIGLLAQYLAHDIVIRTQSSFRQWYHSNMVLGSVQLSYQLSFSIVQIPF